MLLRKDALERWLLGQAVAWAALLPALGVWLVVAGPAPGQFAVLCVAVVAGHVVLVRILDAGRPLADKVTLLRGAVVLACTGVGASSGAVGWPVWCILGLALLADLADGACARRYGATPGGAMLDMETDQVATLCLAFLLAAVGGVGAWVLVLPGYRYAFVLWLARRGLPAADPKPCAGDNGRARWVCAAMMVLLFVALCPPVPVSVARVFAGVSVALLAYSYGSDVVFLWRRREAVG